MKKIIFFLLLLINLSAQAQYKKLFDFNGLNGSNPYGNLTFDNNVFYGMTQTGGKYYKNSDTLGYGIIFKINTDGSGFDTLMSFNGANGAFPLGSLTVSQHLLYGITSGGGSFCKGVVFNINTDGSGFDTLMIFNGKDGAFPHGELLPSGNTLYSMTSGGGRFYKNDDTVGNGVIFKINTDGSGFDTLMNFNGTNGKWSCGSLTLSGNTLYGMTLIGGKYNKGVIFRINDDGTGFDTLISFNGKNGLSPGGSLTLSENNLYGMTWSGGKYYQNQKLDSAGYGVIFKINTDGSSFDTLISFNGTNGFYSTGNLTLSGNTLYGMTQAGGKYNDGLIFKINTDGGGFDTLMSFNGTNGKMPQGSLTISGNALYGMTTFGGTNNCGVVFKYNLQATAINSKTETPSFTVFPNPAYDNIDISTNILSTDPKQYISLYDIQGHLVLNLALTNKHTQINISGLDAGTYIVELVSDNISHVCKLIKE